MAGRQAAGRGPRRGLRLTRTGALAVDRARRDLLGAVLRRPALLRRVLDVLVLPGALRALLDASGWHGSASFGSLRLQQDLEGPVLLLLKDLVGVRRLLEGDAIRREVVDPERILVSSNQPETVEDSALALRHALPQGDVLA